MSNQSGAEPNSKVSLYENRVSGEVTDRRKKNLLQSIIKYRCDIIPSATNVNVKTVARIL